MVRIIATPTDWYHTSVGICRNVGMVEYRTFKYAMLLGPNQGAVKSNLIRSRYNIISEDLVGFTKLSLVIDN